MVDMTRGQLDGNEYGVPQEVRAHSVAPAANAATAAVQVHPERGPAHCPSGCKARPETRRVP